MTSETTALWTDEKHVHYLNSMEASFVHKMLQNKGNSTTASTTRHSLRLDRYLPDTSESTLDLKPNPRRRTANHHAPSDSVGPTTRRSRRRSSQPYNYSPHDQVVPQVVNEREGAACNYDDDKSAAS